MKGKLLIVDDERNILRVISATLKKEGYEVEVARTGEEALDKFSTNHADLVVTDFKLPGMSGADMLSSIKSINPDVPVIMLTAYGTIERVVEAMKRGAFNYLTKPVNPDELVAVVKEAMEKYRLIRENLALKNQLKERYSFNNIIGKSQAMQEVFNLIEVVSKSNANVLVTGECGTGKELAARAMHYASSRSNRPFIPIDCAAIPEELLESELFGHEKGAFTGAHDRKVGQVELANGGTLFLDEVGDLYKSLQKKLLRFLQEREILRVGGKDRIKVDVRIIAATNKNLMDDVDNGRFREDLFYRLNVVGIHIPPLRERKEDIPLLANHFLEKFNRRNNKSIKGFSSDVIDVFLEHKWHGNVRELENAIERAVVLCPIDTITLNYLPGHLKQLKEKDDVCDEFNLTEVEKRLLLKALKKTSWNQTKAAEILGITRRQLRTKMKNLRLLPIDDSGTSSK
ncbi:MAG: sigma-54-dependent Fis family transcriptional regulator [Nitrospirae bacterium]|nr:sigma-54-dependent Fis family transcriptional regulator [Nitrospirota bacterium]